jgi:RNA polymerase sigma factor (sigma-70 family)
MRRTHGGAAIRQMRLLFGEGALAGLSDAEVLERYVSGREELAFEALVHRHGAMVLGVCRRILRDSDDADDAFQAAFFLLARKAKSLWIEDSLGGWLHRVASRIALQMRADAARRRDREACDVQRAAARYATPSLVDEAEQVIHQEINRLPDRYREPLVLCCLEGMTYAQAAARLRWSEGTTQRRLAGARSLLRARLARRGVTPVVAVLGVIDRTSGASSVPEALRAAAVRAARHIVLGEGAAVGPVSTAIDALVIRAMRSMVMARIGMMARAGLIVGALAFAAVALPALGGNSADEPGTVARRDADDDTGRPVNRSRDLRPGERLEREDSLFSSLAGFRLLMRADGNLVLSCIDEDAAVGRDVIEILAHAPRALGLYTTQLWSTGTDRLAPSAGAHCVMQEDGNLVIYDEAMKPCFSTGTAGHPGAFLRLQNDGNLVIYAPDRTALWASQTHARHADWPGALHDLPPASAPPPPPVQVGPIGMRPLGSATAPERRESARSTGQLSGTSNKSDS